MMTKCGTCIHYGNPTERVCGTCYNYEKYKFVLTPIEQPEQSKKTALTWQEGGQHYKDKAIQPIVYIHANKLGFCEGNVVKYITRHKEKNGAEDIKKVIHYCELLLELEYKNE
jgi:Protein of unknwon function (DUF3310)